MYRDALTSTASLSGKSNAGALKAPILTPATELVKCGDVETFLHGHLPPEEIRSAFSIECLLVDALDEVPQEEQAETLTLACDVADELNCALVVSARPVQVIRTLSEQSALNMPIVQLLPFEYSQARQLIDRLVRDPDIVEILREGLVSLRNHMSLSPLAVSLLMDIAEAEREVPGTIGEIFEQYMDIALGRYDVERGIDVVFQYFIKKQLLSEVAWYEFFKKDRLTITEQEFDVFLKTYFEDRLFDLDMIPRMKSDIDRSGVIRFSDGAYFAQRREIFADFFDEAARLEEETIDFHWRTFTIGRLIQAGWLSPTDIKSKGIAFGVKSAPTLFELLADETVDMGPGAVPYAILTGLAEHSYSSRTLRQEISREVIELTAGDSIGDFRNAVYLLWANRTRISTEDSSAQADLILDLMARLEKSKQLQVEDKAVGYLVLETIVEDDKERQRAIARRFRRLVRAQPIAINKLLNG